MKLYEIDMMIEALLNASVDRETGEILPDVLAELDALERERDTKALAVAAYIVGQEAEAEAVRAQAKKLEERAARHERHAESLRQYLAGHIPQGTKLRDSRVEIGWRKSSAVEVGDARLLPESLLRVTVNTAPDKAAIREALERGEEVQGCRIVERVKLVVK